MRTKEALINEYDILQFDEMKKFSRSKKAFSEEQVEHLMDLYAKDQAIAFLEYKQDQGYILEHARNEYMKIRAADIHKPRLSPEALYVQFIESQSTNNKEV
jgi:predicted RNA-binding protein